MGKTMKAAVLRKPELMVIEEVPIPEPKAGWVRLKNKACGICGSDMHIYTGNHPWLKPGHPMEKFVLGHVYGHEISGVVDALGDGVTGVRVGDRAAVFSIVPCMRCEFCRVGLYQICKNLEHFGFHHSGGFAEYTLVPAAHVVPVPEHISFEEAALLDVLEVAVHAVHVAKITLSDTVALLGAGPIGIAIASIAKRAGARELFVVAKHPAQKELARRIGAHMVLDPRKDDVVKQVTDATGGLGVDCAVECVGYKSKTLELALDLIRKGGRIVFTGVFEENVTLNFGTLLIKEAALLASHACGMWDLVHEVDLAMQFLSEGVFPARALVSHTFPLEKINEAFHIKITEPERAMKVMLLY